MKSYIVKFFLILRYLFFLVMIGVGIYALNHPIKNGAKTANGTIDIIGGAIGLVTIIVIDYLTWKNDKEKKSKIDTLYSNITKNKWCLLVGLLSIVYFGLNLFMLNENDLITLLLLGAIMLCIKYRQQKEERD